MIKLIVVAGLSLAFSSTLLAAETSLFGSPSSTAPASSQPDLKGKVLSPSDYTNQVSKQSAQNDSAFQQKLDQQLSQVKEPSPMQPVATPPAAQMNTKTETPPAIAPATKTNAKNPEPLDNLFPETKPKATAAPKPAAPTPVTNYNSTPSTPSGQIYTGFSKTQPGSGTPAPTSAPAGAGSLNIKY